MSALTIADESSKKAKENGLKVPGSTTTDVGRRSKKFQRRDLALAFILTVIFDSGKGMVCKSRCPFKARNILK